MRKLIKGELSAAALRALGATPREVRTLCAWANQQALAASFKESCRA